MTLEQTRPTLGATSTRQWRAVQKAGAAFSYKITDMVLHIVVDVKHFRWCGLTFSAGQSYNADFTFTPKATGLVTETVGVTASYKVSAIRVISLEATITGITVKGTGQ